MRCGAVVGTVMLTFTGVFGPLPAIGVELQVASAGKPLQVKPTAVVKLLEAIKLTVLVPDIPGLVIVTFVGPEIPAKPGWMVKVTGCAVLLELKLASPA